MWDRSLDFREMNLLQWEPFTTNPLGVMPSGYAPEVFPLPEMMKKARPYYEEMKKEVAAKTTDKIKFGVGVSIVFITPTMTEQMKLQATLS